MRLRKPSNIFPFFEKKLLTKNQESVECPQIEATTATTKTKNQTRKNDHRYLQKQPNFDNL